MKFIHLSDLHLGKRVNEFPMIEDQQYILTEIINIIDDENPDAVVIAGDVYDKTMPSADAMGLYENFIYRLADRKIPVLVISGNHDSAERLSHGRKFMELGGVHVSPVYNGEIRSVVIEDKYGPVNFYLLPFVKPIHVRTRLEDDSIVTYTDAVRAAIEHMDVNADERNVIVTHQFVTGASRSDSEEQSVGGSDNVDASVFDCFDYVALGHIHGPQSIGRETVRYCGTPLKYSFSEKDHEKSVTVVEMGETKADIVVRTVPLVPRHDMREIRGLYDDLMNKSSYEGTAVDDYLRIILEDEDEIMDVMSRMRTVYPKIMKLEYDNKRTRASRDTISTESVENKRPVELFNELFEIQNGQEMNEAQRKLAESMIEKIWEAEQ